MGLKLYHTVIWICIFLVINSLEHLHVCLVAIHKSSWEKCLLKLFAHFLVGSFLFFYHCLEQKTFYKPCISCRGKVHNFYLFWWLFIYEHTQVTATQQDKRYFHLPRSYLAPQRKPASPFLSWILFTPSPPYMNGAALVQVAITKYRG